MGSSDPIGIFEHDHAELNGGVRDLGEQLRRLVGEPTVSPRIESRLSTLREDMVMHFVREEEALFPQLSLLDSDLAQRADDLVAMHDEICGSLTRLIYLASTGATPEVLLAAFSRFETTYARHVEAELSLFQQIRGSVTPAQLAELTTLIGGL